MYSFDRRSNTAGELAYTIKILPFDLNSLECCMILKNLRIHGDGESERQSVKQLSNYSIRHFFFFDEAVSSSGFDVTRGFKGRWAIGGRRCKNVMGDK